MPVPKIIFMPHANLQYSQLAPEKRAWVVMNSYEPLFDLVIKNDYKIAFEASGYSIDFIAEHCPKVMAKLSGLIRDGKVEPVASPYTHIMMSNVMPEIGLQTLIHSLDCWEKHTGVRPSAGWNPECGWASYIPEIYQAAGFKALVMDADSFFLSFDPIRNATGLSYDVQGHSNKNHLFKIEEFIRDKPDFLKYLTNPSVAENGLQLIFRSDCMANPMLWYLMGATEGNRETPVAIDEIRTMLMNWKDRIAASGTFIMPYAEDAEYIGTSAYFYVKQFNQARFFEPEPGSITRFQQMLDLAKECGYRLSLPAEVLASGRTFKNDYVNCIENGAAWHGGTAKAWANTEYSRIMDPVCLAIYYGIKAVGDYLGGSDPELEKAVKAVTSAYVSDSRWPPPPTSPGRFNVRESISDLYAANRLLGAVMERRGIANLKSLYSPTLMGTQIKCIEDKLMGLKYFGEDSH